MLLPLLLSVWLSAGMWPNSANRQKRAVAAIERNRGKVGYDCRIVVEPNGWRAYHLHGEPAAPTWLRWLVGKHYFMDAAWIRVGSNAENCLAGLVDLPGIEIAFFDGALDRDLEHVEHLRKLRYLSLRRYTVSDANPSPFWVLERLPNLETLVLSGTQFDNRDAKYLRRAAILKHLDLSDTHIGDEGLADLKTLDSLEYLELGSTKVTDRGIAYLSDLPKLKNLRLDYTDVSDSSSDSFSKMQALRELSLYKANVEEIGRLRSALPKCVIAYKKRDSQPDAARIPP